MSPAWQPLFRPRLPLLPSFDSPSHHHLLHTSIYPFSFFFSFSCTGMGLNSLMIRSFMHLPLSSTVSTIDYSGKLRTHKQKRNAARTNATNGLSRTHPSGRRLRHDWDWLSSARQRITPSSSHPRNRPFSPGTCLPPARFKRYPLLFLAPDDRPTDRMSTCPAPCFLLQSSMSLGQPARRRMCNALSTRLSLQHQPGPSRPAAARNRID